MANNLVRVTSREITEFQKSVTKCLNSYEKPLDTQLLRSIILFTHKAKDSSKFWDVVNKQLLTINRFTAWKFCDMLHRLLRDGHPQTFHDARKQLSKLHQLGSYWTIQPGAMEQCVAQYCRLLVFKLELHNSYNFLSTTFQTITTAEFDLNTCFPLCADLCELMDHFLLLQQLIFTDLSCESLSTESSSGRCRLMPLITITSECSALYEYLICVLSHLCVEMPPEDTLGLRYRFDGINLRMHDFKTRLQQLESLREFITWPELLDVQFGALQFPKAQWQNMQTPQPTAPPEFLIEF